MTTNAKKNLRSNASAHVFRMKPRLLQDFSETQNRNAKLTSTSLRLTCRAERHLQELHKTGVLRVQGARTDLLQTLEGVHQGERTHLDQRYVCLLISCLVLMKKRDTIKIMDQKMSQLVNESKKLIDIIEMKSIELLDLYKDYSRINTVLGTTISVFRKESENHEKLK